MEKVRPWCGQPSDRGRLKNRNRNRALTFRLKTRTETKTEALRLRLRPKLSVLETLASVVMHHMLCSIGNTLWLDPLVQREWLTGIQHWTEKCNVRTLLLEHEYVAENSEVCCDFISCCTL